MDAKILKALKHRDLNTVKSSINSDNVNDRDEEGCSVLHHAVSFYNIDAVNYILSLDDVNINIRDIDGWTPLLIAVKFNYFIIAEILLEHCADWSLRTKKGFKVYDIIKSHNMKELLDIYINAIDIKEPEFL